MYSSFFEKSEKICYIIGAFECGKINVQKQKDDIIICADGGVLLAEKNGITPDVIMGDFDSLGYVPKGENIKVYPTEKDDSDVSIAIKYGFEHGYKSFIIHGAVGGRTDHTIANVQMLSYVAKEGGRGVLVGEKELFTVIKNSEIALCGKGIVSVFSLSDKSEKVTIQNLKYTLDGAVLCRDFPLGLSNEFINERPALVRVGQGELLIVVEKSDMSV